MEKLKDAIERARSERDGLIGNLARYAEDGGEPSRIVVPKGYRRTTDPNPSEIQYVQTRQVALDPIHMEQHRVIAGQLGDERVEPYRQLRTQVLHAMDQNGWNTLAITSPDKNAGKTLTAVNLAVSIAQEVNHTVLLVDLDLAQPNVHTVLGVEVPLGIVDVIQGKARIDEVLVNPGIQRLVVLPGKPLNHYSSEFLTSPGMRNLLNDLSKHYQSRIVIFDLPPLLRNDDALKFTPYADATLMVVEAGGNTPDEVQRSVHLMKNANLLGTILNKARG